MAYRFQKAEWVFCNWPVTLRKTSINGDGSTGMLGESCSGSRNASTTSFWPPEQHMAGSMAPRPKDKKERRCCGNVTRWWQTSSYALVQAANCQRQTLIVTRSCSSLFAEVFSCQKQISWWMTILLRTGQREHCFWNFSLPMRNHRPWGKAAENSGRIPKEWIQSLDQN